MSVEMVNFSFVLAPGESKKLEFPEGITDALITKVVIVGATDEAKGKPVALVCEVTTTDYNSNEGDEMKTIREECPVIDFIVGEGEQEDTAVNFAAASEDEPVLKVQGAASLEITGTFILTGEEEEEEEEEAKEEEKGK